jgi:hypothetical protein
MKERALPRRTCGATIESGANAGFGTISFVAVLQA